MVLFGSRGLFFVLLAYAASQYLSTAVFNNYKFTMQFVDQHSCPPVSLLHQTRSFFRDFLPWTMCVLCTCLIPVRLHFFVERSAFFRWPAEQWPGESRKRKSSGTNFFYASGGGRQVRWKTASKWPAMAAQTVVEIALTMHGEWNVGASDGIHSKYKAQTYRERMEEKERERGHSSTISLVLNYFGGARWSTMGASMLLFFVYRSRRSSDHKLLHRNYEWTNAIASNRIRFCTLNSQISNWTKQAAGRMWSVSGCVCTRVGRYKHQCCNTDRQATGDKRHRGQKLRVSRERCLRRNSLELTVGFMSTILVYCALCSFFAHHVLVLKFFALDERSMHVSHPPYFCCFAFTNVAVCATLHAFSTYVQCSIHRKSSRTIWWSSTS